MLAALLGSDARELFDWPRDLSVIDFSARGLYPHDVVRRALAGEREAIREAAGVLELSPHDRRGFRALHHSHPQSAPTAGGRGGAATRRGS